MAGNSNKQNRGNSNQPQGNQGSQALNSYSNNLGAVAKQLSDAAKSFKTSADAIERSNENLIDNLHNLARAFGKEMKDTTKSQSKNAKTTQEASEDITKGFDRATREGDELLDKGQMIGGALIKTAQKAFTFVFEKYKRAFNSVLNNYTQNLEAITSRMQLSNAQYSLMLDQATKRISGDNLKREFSQIDFSDALIPVLQTGIRGGLAEEMAYRNMITNRVLPMINTNTRAYTRMSKLFGDTFTQGIQAVGTYTERMLDSAEGLEEGGYDTAIQTVYREVMEQVRMSGGSESDVGEMMQEILLKYSDIASTFGKDYAEKTLQDYSAFVRGDSIMQAELESLLPGITAQNATFEEYVKAQQDLITTYMGTMKSSYASTGFGFDVTVIQDVLNGLYFQNKDQLKDTELTLKNFNKDAENKKTMDNLTKGYYQSVTDQMNNWNENTMARLATLAGEKLPDAADTLNDIWGLLEMWFPILFTAMTSGNLLKDGGGALGKLFGVGAGGAGAKKLLSKGAETAGEGAGEGAGGAGASKGLAALMGKSVGSGGATVGGIAAGATGFAVGGVLTVKDLIGAGSETWSDTSDVGKTIGSGALAGLLTGRGLMTSAKQKSNLQKALAGEKVSFDWGSLGLNAAKGAGIGAGIGTATAGWAAGSGTVIGTVVGAIGGAISNAVQQWIENAKFNKFADALNEATDAIQNLQYTAEAYNEAEEQEISFTEAYNKIRDGDLKGGISDLIQLFPQYSKRIEKITDENDSYLTVLQTLVEADKRRAERENIDAARGAVDAVRSEIDKGEDAVSGHENLLKLYGIEAAKEIDENWGKYGNGFEGAEATVELAKEQYADFLKKTGQTTSDISFTEFIKRVNRATGWNAETGVYHLGVNSSTDTYEVLGNVYNYKDQNSSNPRGTTGWTTLGHQNIKETAAQTVEPFNTFDEVVQKMIDGWSDTLTNFAVAESYARGPDGEFLSNEEVIDKFPFGEADRQYLDIQSILSDLGTELKDIKTNSIYISDGMKSVYQAKLEPYMDEYIGLWRSFGLDNPDYKMPEFSKGIAYVPYDNYPAILHAGETVLPAIAAENLRQLAQSDTIQGISQFLSNMVGTTIASATASPLNDNNVSALIVTAIGEAVNVIKAVLDVISGDVSSIRGYASSINSKLELKSNIPDHVSGYRSIIAGV